MSSSSQTTTIPLHSLLHFIPIKLTSSNYLAWSHQITPVLSSQNLHGHIDGTKPPPPETITTEGKITPNPEFAAWRDADQSVRLLIQSSLSEEAMAEIIGLTNARQIWKALEAAYSHCSVERIHILRDTLRQLHKGSSTVSEFGRKFKSLCDQLAAIGRPVDETDKCHWFLCGLGPSFENFSTTHRAISATTSFRDLLAKAETQEFFLQSIHGSSQPQAAFVAQQSRNGNSRNSQNSSFSNRGRGRSSGRGRARRLPHCQLCRKEGHYASACPSLSTYAQRAPSLDANLAQAFHAQCHVTENYPDWTGDTGATAHMTPSQDDLSTTFGTSGSKNEEHPGKRHM